MAQDQTGDIVTLCAIAILAFILADIAHEVVGHGIGFILAGGHHCVLTTTRLNETQRLGDHGGDLFDLGGPFGNLLCAAMAWLALRNRSALAPNFRVFLWLTTSFSLFWAFAYLMFCGVFGHGDWFALIRTAPHQWLWRIVFAALGFLLYRGSMKLLASELRQISFRSRLISYLAAGCIACAGAALDPRGPYALFHDAALSSFGSAIGLLAISRQLPPAIHLDRSPIWIASAAIASAFYIFILGLGIKATL
jgi:hypothetical protein